MTQEHIIVNLSKREVLDPIRFQDNPQLKEFAMAEKGTMFALAWLLENSWSGDYITIAGKEDLSGDYDDELMKSLGIHRGSYSLFDIAKSVVGYQKVPTIEEFTKPHVLKGRTLYSEDIVAFGTAQTFKDVAQPVIDDLCDKDVAYFRPKNAFDINRFEGVVRSRSIKFSIVVNEETGEALDPRAFGDSGRVLSFGCDGKGGTMTALALMLASGAKGRPLNRDDFYLNPHSKHLNRVGSWANSRITFRPCGDMKYMKNISADVRSLLEESNHAQYNEDRCGKFTRDLPQYRS